MESIRYLLSDVDGNPACVDGNPALSPESNLWIGAYVNEPFFVNDVNAVYVDKTDGVTPALKKRLSPMLNTEPFYCVQLTKTVKAGDEICALYNMPDIMYKRLKYEKPRDAEPEMTQQMLLRRSQVKQQRREHIVNVKRRGRRRKKYFSF